MVVGSGGCQRILAALKRRAGILIGVEFFLERSLLGGVCSRPWESERYYICESPEQSSQHGALGVHLSPTVAPPPSCHVQQLLSSS